MEYKQMLSAQVDKYYGQIIMKYQTTAAAAMQDGKRTGLFRKVDFSNHIENFQKHIEDVKKIDTSTIVIPPEDIKSDVLADCLNRSAESFCTLCEKCILFYDVSDKKQYKGSGIKVSDYKEAFIAMHDAIEAASKDLGILDKAYEEYNADNLAD